MKATFTAAIFLCGLAIPFANAMAVASYPECTNHVEIVDAVEKDNFEDFKTLIEASGTNGNCYVADNNMPVLIVALDFKRLDMIKYLVEDLNTDVNIPRLENGMQVSTPLFEAIWKIMSIDTIKMLVENGADVNYVGDVGASVLTLAEYTSLYKDEYKAVVEYLVANGANNALVDNSGLSACDFATANQNEEMKNALNC